MAFVVPTRDIDGNVVRPKPLRVRLRLRPITVVFSGPIPAVPKAGDRAFALKAPRVST